MRPRNEAQQKKCRATARRWYRKNRKRRLAQNRAWRKANEVELKARGKVKRAAQSSSEHETEKQRQRRWYRKNQRYRIAKAKVWKQVNCERVRELARVAYKKDPRRMKRAYLKYTYGLTIEAYETQVARQKNRCAICRTVVTVLHVDHDHRTMKFRGLLCGHCNRGLGCFFDTPKALRAAARYLIKQLNNA